MKLGRDTHLDEFTNQPELMKNHLDPFMSIINGAKTPLQQHAVMWCIENLIPLLQLDSHNWIFSTYEELCVNTEKEIKKVLTNLRLKNTSQVRKTMKRPFQTRSGSAITNSKDVVLDWQNHLSKEEIAEILDIVSKFNIRIYGEGPMPTYNHNK